MSALLLALTATLLSAALAASSSSTAASSALAASSTCVAWNYTLSHNFTMPVAADFGSAAAYLPPADDAVAAFDWGFPFTFYGVNYTAANVSTNGNIQFTTGSIAWVDSQFPVNMSAAPQPVPLIAQYYVDLNPDLAWMQQVAVLGQAPQRQAVVRYVSVPVCPFDQNATHNDTANDTSLIDAQPAVSCDVILYEADYSVAIQYYNIDPTPWPVDVGVQGAGGAGYTAAVDHQPMDEVAVQWLANSTLTFTPVCTQYQLGSAASTGMATGGGAGIGTGTGTGSGAAARYVNSATSPADCWSRAFMTVLLLIVPLLML